MILTSFFDLFQPSSMRITLNLHLNFVHIKPQQPNCFDSCTDTGNMHQDIRILTIGGAVFFTHLMYGDNQSSGSMSIVLCKIIKVQIINFPFPVSEQRMRHK